MVDEILNFKCWKFKNEAQFTSWFWKQCKEKWYFFFKLSDADRRIKPFDAFVMAEWYPIAIEFKINDNSSCYPYRMLKGSSMKNPWWQVKWLTNYVKNGWYWLIIIYNRVKQGYMIVGIRDIDFYTKYSFKC